MSGPASVRYQQSHNQIAYQVAERRHSLADGLYNLTSTLYINGRNNVTIRGTAGEPSVVLVGKGMDNSNYGNVPFGV
jgi:hypothetical protein